jgi:hypothetical protein
MGKCGKGWKIKCSHRSGVYTNEDKPPYYEVVADTYYGDLANSNPDLEPKEDLKAKNVDILEIHPGCAEDNCTVQMDGVSPQYVKNKKHYLVPAMFDRYDALSSNPKEIHHFIQTLERAFGFIFENKKEERTLTIDGDQLKVHVYPGERFKLDLDFPGIFLTKTARGLDAKNSPSLGGATDERGTTSVKETNDHSGPAGDGKRLTPEQEQRLLSHLSGFSNKNWNLIFRYAKQSADEAAMFAGQGKVYDAIIKPLADLNFSLYQNNEKLRLAGFESLAAILGLIQEIMDVFNSLQAASLKVGWYWEIKLEAFKFQTVMEWGYLEMDDYEVLPFVALGANCTLLDADIEIGFGIKAAWFVAALYVKFSGERKVDVAVIYPEPKMTRNSSYIGGGLSITPEIGAKIKGGKLLTAQIDLTAKFTADIKYYFTFRSRLKNDPLMELEATLSPFKLSAVIIGGKYQLFGFTQENMTKPLSYKEIFPKPIVDPAQEPGESTFTASLIKYLSMAQPEGKNAPCLIARSINNYFPYTEGDLVPPAELAAHIVRAIQNIARDQYVKFFDFSDKSAEGVFLGVIKILDQEYSKRDRSGWWFHDPYCDLKNFLRILDTDSMRELVRNHYDPVKVFRDTINQYHSANQA